MIRKGFLWGSIFALVYYFNHSLFFMANSISSDIIRKEMLFISTMADGFFIGLFLMAIHQRPLRKMPDIFLAFAVTTALVHIMKEIFPMPRPVTVFGDGLVHWEGIRLTVNSFPSGHSAAAFFLTRVMTYKNPSRKSVILWMLLGMNAALSRVVIGVHFPIDILAGSLIGFYGADFIIKKSFLRKRKIIRFFYILSPFLGLVLSFFYLFFYTERIPEYEFVTIPLVFMLGIIFLKKALGFVWPQKFKKTENSAIHKTSTINIFFPVVQFFIFIYIALKTLLQPFRYLLLFLFVIILIAYSMELGYVFHLARHQIYVMSHYRSLESWAQESENTKYADKIKLIRKASAFARDIYGMPHSKSYSQVVDLKREAIGTMITVSHPYEFRTLSFFFPIAGSFSYLGFFDQNVLRSFLRHYKNQGYDINLGEIAAYSTLQFFTDPVFNTYLNQSDEWLIQLVFHEMAHERLFFKDDVFFSEQLAVYLQHRMKNDFMEVFPGSVQRETIHANPQFRKTVSALFKNLKQNLQGVYLSDISPIVKLIRKHLAILAFYGDFTRLSQQNGEFSLLEQYPIESINNALFLQSERYRHSPEAFERIYETCRENAASMTTEQIMNANMTMRKQSMQCFLEKISALKRCSPEDRKLFAESRHVYSEIMESCVQKNPQN